MTAADLFVKLWGSNKFHTNVRAMQPMNESHKQSVPDWQVIRDSGKKYKRHIDEKTESESVSWSSLLGNKNPESR